MADKPKMIYRRFGSTEINMPVITCGGMRFQQSWDDFDEKAIEAQVQENLEACVQYAFANGINHFETARGYGSSELQLGRILPDLPRDEIIVQTKIGPKDSEDEFLRTFDTSLKNLRLDYVDLFAVHGINAPFLLRKTLKGGIMQALRRLQEEGRIRHIGFSTHGPTDVIIQAIETGEFSYVNLHWFYFDQKNLPAIEAAARHDMGVFIISPNDKGGKLYEPPEKLVRLCEPLTPMGFNDLFCLADKRVHTLSMGVAKPQDFDEHLAILPHLPQAAATIAPILNRLHDEAVKVHGQEWVEHWQEGLPENCGNAPLYHIVRMMNMYRAYDMLAFGKMRYNLLGSGKHWFPGDKVDKLDFEALKKCLQNYRFADRIPQILREAHQLFNAADTKRLSES